METKLDEIYKIMRKYVDMLVVSRSKDEPTALAIISSGGLRKSWEITHALEDKGLVFGKDYAVMTTYTTPLAFYEWLYANRDKLCVIEDTLGIFENNVSVSILKSACWNANGKRLVMYNSTKKRTVPREFEFTGRVLFTMNGIPTGDESFCAMLTRIHRYPFKPTHAERVAIIKEVAKNVDGLTLEKREEVADFICKYAGKDDLNVRTLIRALQLRSYSEDDWQEMMLAQLELDGDLMEAKRAMEKNDVVSEQVKAFKQATGKGRATFYRLKKVLRFETSVRLEKQ